MDSTINCDLKHNCKNLEECPFCNDYQYYAGINRKILSPPMVAIKAQKCLERREFKHTDQSKMGRRNKRAGKRAEKDLESLLINWGYEAKRVPLSGALKNIYSHLAGDLNLTVGQRTYRVEVKRRSNLNTLYKITECSALTIEGFCIIMNETKFNQLLNGFIPESEVVADKRQKRLHDWFDQDNSNIVAMKSNRRSWIFAVRLDTMRELTT